MIEYPEFAEIVCGKFGISPEEAMKIDLFEDMGIDSLSLYSMVTEVEMKLSIKIDTNDITEVNALSRMYSYVCRKMEGS